MASPFEDVGRPNLPTQRSSSVATAVEAAVNIRKPVRTKRRGRIMFERKFAVKNAEIDGGYGKSLPVLASSGSFVRTARVNRVQQ